MKTVNEIARRAVAKSLKFCRLHGAHLKDGEPYLCTECAVTAAQKAIDSAVRALTRLGALNKEKRT